MEKLINLLTFDKETSTYQKGNAYSRRNVCCLTGLLSVVDGVETEYKDLNWLEDPHPVLVREMQERIDWADLIIGFNIKFDLTWARRMGINFQGKRIYDVQLAEFILSNQTMAYPSLNGCAEKYGLGQKLDVVKTEYWEKGIDTPDIPYYILSEYCAGDVRLTYACYLYQEELFKSQRAKRKLLSLQFQDLLVLQEMEWNGLKYNETKSIELGDELAVELDQICKRLDDYFPDVPINWGSGDHTSACLYGGLIRFEHQEPVGVYKTGIRAGEVKMGWKEKLFLLPRLVEPLSRSESEVTKKLSDDEVKLKKGFRVYSTNEATLLSLSAKSKAKSVITDILRRSELEKLRGTYYHGLPAMAREMDWPENELHGQYNQVVARTGRLSSNAPNLQNFPPQVDALIYSRY